MIESNEMMAMQGVSVYMIHLLITDVRLVITTTVDDSKVCGADQFACQSGNECIAIEKLCDGQNDCLDYSDEYHEDCSRKKWLIPSFHSFQHFLHFFHFFFFEFLIIIIFFFFLLFCRCLRLLCWL